MVILVFFVDILQLPQTVISNSEKLTHPIIHIYQEVPMLQITMHIRYAGYCN